MKFLFIRKDITQVPTDSQFIRNVEEKGGHIADKVRFPGVFSVSSIGLPIGSDQPRKVRKDDVRRCSNSERTTPVWADRCDRVVYAPCDTCVLQGAPTGDEGVCPVKIHPTVALNTMRWTKRLQTETRHTGPLLDRIRATKRFPDALYDRLCLSLSNRAVTSDKGIPPRSWRFGQAPKHSLDLSTPGGGPFHVGPLNLDREPRGEAHT